VSENLTEMSLQYEIGLAVLTMDYSWCDNGAGIKGLYMGKQLDGTLRLSWDF
jgi:hypothetical protein